MGLGLLIVGIVAGMLIGYGFPLPSQTSFQDCMPQGCSEPSAASQPIELKAAASRPTRAAAQVKSARAAKPKKRSIAKSSKRAVAVKRARPAAKTAARAPERRDETSDLILNMAKSSVAVQMEDPASVEFSDMKRATRKDTLGRPVDTICGHVRGKTASGEQTERPFLYLVKEDESYVVDGNQDSAAAAAYRNICN